MGTIAPNSRSARFQRNAGDHFLVRFLASTLALGVAAAWPERPFALAPVDFVAASVLALADLPDARSGDTYHVVSPHQLSHRRLLSVLLAMGYPIDVVEPEDFAALVMERARARGLEAAIGGVLSLIDPPAGTRLRVDSGATEALLAEAGLRCPAPSADWLRRSIERLARLGHLPDPPIRFSRAEIEAGSGERGGDGSSA